MASGPDPCTKLYAIVSTLQEPPSDNHRNVCLLQDAATRDDPKVFNEIHVRSTVIRIYPSLALPPLAWTTCSRCCTPALNHKHRRGHLRPHQVRHADDHSIGMLSEGHRCSDVLRIIGCGSGIHCARQSCFDSLLAGVAIDNA